MTTKWEEKDNCERQGVAITELIISRQGQIFRGQETNDVGIDAHVELVNTKSKEVTGQLVALQIKSGPSFLEEKTGDSFIFRGALKHLEYWLSHSLPVFLVLVDIQKQTAYWQEILPEVVERLDRGWKVSIPFTHELQTNFVTAAMKRVGLDVTTSSYTRPTLKDTSIATTKRYTAHILMRPPVTRLRAEAVVRHANADIVKERYNLDAFKVIFGDRDADVVSLYVAGNLSDVENSNWYCRTMWVSKELATELRPNKIGGEDLGDGLEAVWNADYATSSQFYHDKEIDKQTFLAATNKFNEATKKIIKTAFGKGSQINCTPTELRQHAANVRDLFTKSGDIGQPPYECKDVAQRFEDAMVFADNAFIYAANIESEPANGSWPYLLENALENYHKNLDRLGYEFEKVR